MNKSSIHRENLDKIFCPKSVAVIGATKTAGTVPCDIIHNIIKSEYQGIVYPVSPKEKAISGLRTYKYCVDITDPVDLAIIVFPSSVCHLALEQCGQQGIKAAIIISAGFREVGGKGIEKEQQIKEIADKYGISFIGPNCLGVINTDPNISLNASFSRTMPEEGNIGFISQSGALCTAVLDYAHSKHIGFSKFISFGNKADISEIDLLNYLAKDEKTKVILIYLEEVKNGKALMKCAQDIIKTTGKPILAIKSGRTTEGASAAASHTGSLAGKDEVCDAALKQAGIIRCENIQEMFNIAIAFAYQPKPENQRVAIITNAGGPGVLTTDAAIHDELKLAEFSEETLAEFSKKLPKTANIKNPVDVIGDALADRYNVAISGALKDKNVDGAFIILTPQSMTQIEKIAEEIVTVSKNFEKPVYTSFMGATSVAKGIDILQRNKIPHYILPEAMSNAYSRVYNFNRNGTLVDEKEVILTDDDYNAIDSILKDYSSASFLTEDISNKILSRAGLPVFDGKVAASEEEAVLIAEEIGYPVVMKICSDKIIHKSEIHGVKLNLKTKADVINAFSEIINNASEKLAPTDQAGVYMTKMIKPGEEMIIGVSKDNSFGHVLLFGKGGIYVELFEDVSLRVIPIKKKDAVNMVAETKSSVLLNGFRGAVPKEKECIYECLLRISNLVNSFPQIKELDINPLIVHDKGCCIADARIILEKNGDQ